ncbi:uncharacterized protein LOC120289944 [Eucalyptus grandis]|uniref:uncharacterized protein LOC120289944 n=1 Tax=Eucalyptus grandis TaxID=71139 RepID=UPI00192F05BA|nr:uncharacterized protein LOC120289944 [Eucalyptus grandis]
MENFTEEEVTIAMQQLGAFKAPGPDGFHGIFYREHWPVVSKDIHQALQLLFTTGHLDPALNRTQITLIPKVPQPEKLEQYRPISLCNFLYKIISKVLTNRLKPILPHIIAEEQSAFVGGRQIQDNILIVQEVLHRLRTSNKRKKFQAVLKLDMQKAYDRIEWDFLKACLTKMGFCDKWITWIMQCVSTIMECQNLADILNQYCFASGQAINLNKSGIYFSKGCPTDLRRNMASALRVPEIAKTGKYLGIPSDWGHSKNDMFAWILARVNSKLSSWKEKLLSKAGKEILIKAVVQAIPQYAMSIYKIPISICKAIEKKVASFWWKSNEKNTAIHWKKWDLLKTGKGEGGLGFKDLQTVNKALLAKQMWRIIQNPDSLLTRLWKGLYYSQRDFWTAGKGSRPSWGWQSIIMARDSVAPQVMHRIGNGKNTPIRTARWLKSGTIRINVDAAFDPDLERNTANTDTTEPPTEMTEPPRHRAAIPCVCRDHRGLIVDGFAKPVAATSALQTSTELSWELNPTGSRAQAKLLHLPGLTLAHYSKNLNRLADWIAKACRNNSLPPDWIYNPPLSYLIYYALML